MTGLSKDFWEDQDKRAPLRNPLQEAEDYRNTLMEVFPKGTTSRRDKDLITTIEVSLGTHWINLVGVSTGSSPSNQQMTWRGYWYQNMTVPGNQLGTDIEMNQRAIKSRAGLGAWLSWVHQGICKESSRVIKKALHPDDFMATPDWAYRASQTLHQISAEWGGVENLIVQKLPWQISPSTGTLRCLVRQQGTKIGMLGVQKKNDYWRYGGEISEAPNLTIKFKDKVAIATVEDGYDAITLCEKLYAENLFKWVMHSKKGSVTSDGP